MKPLNSKNYLIPGELKEYLIGNFHSLERAEIAIDNLCRAAVTVVVFGQIESDNACVFLTLSSATIKSHAGQYTLPGGRIGEGESVEEVALREN